MVIYVRTLSLTKRLRAAATGTSGSPNKIVTERNGLDSWVHILGLHAVNKKSLKFLCTPCCAESANRALARRLEP